jgi:hypothetical protein
MSQLRQVSPRDLEGLSAYVDGQLTPAEAAALERRLEHDSQLRGALQELRQTVSLLRSLPSVPLPRSFALTPEAIGRRPVRWYPVLQLGTALAGLAFVVVIGFDALAQNQPGLAARVLSGGAQAPAAESETGAVSLFAAAGTATPAGTAAAAAEDMLAVQATPEALPPMAAAPTSCPACPREADGTAAADAQKAYPTPTSIPLGQEEGPTVSASRPEPAGISAMRAVEIVLAVLTLVLAFFTLRFRRRGAV